MIAMSWRIVGGKAEIVERPPSLNIGGQSRIKARYGHLRGSKSQQNQCQRTNR
jgi:hypothetical protein